ncbi:MAG: peptidoglycan DD-metalloendopeptidase family protein [Wenzhouxiangellaceae bacterium]|nr:peptidoglycan DD-metalloendopeptidase family protein [Wenzhouxiangellaceae bacterium]
MLLAASALAACGAPGPLPPEARSTRAASVERPDIYRVVGGDTLYSIAFRFGLDWREVARWNDIGPPHLIRPGQTLVLKGVERMGSAVAAVPGERTAAPASSRQPARSRPAPSPTQAGSTPAKPKPAQPVVASTTAPESAPSRAAPAASPPVSSAPVAAAPGGTRSVQGVEWQWPSAGSLARGFDGNSTRKGILIAGAEGQGVVAAADGEVVYSGNGLIGYGELIIVKHSERMLSAYAHNRERLVAEGQRVRAGETIARMGRNEDGRAVLHFEIRRDGQPADPIGFLPPR